MNNLMVQSVFKEHQFMFINFHFFNVDQSVATQLPKINE